MAKYKAVRVNDILVELIKIIGCYGYVDRSIIEKILKFQSVGARDKRIAQLVFNNYLQSNQTAGFYNPQGRLVRCAYSLGIKSKTIYEAYFGHEPKLAKPSKDNYFDLEHQVLLAHTCEKLKELYKDYNPIILNERQVFSEKLKIRADACLLLEIKGLRFGYMIELENSVHGIESYDSKAVRYANLISRIKKYNDKDVEVWEPIFSQLPIYNKHKVKLLRVLYVAKDMQMAKYIQNKIKEVHQTIDVPIDTLVTDIESIMKLNNVNDEIYTNEYHEERIHLFKKINKG